ncbi:hypothetical protein QYM36_001971, partial [Artemia franciscana]
NVLGEWNTIFPGGSFFHICDDTLMIPKGEVGHDKLFKIRRLYDAFRENLKKKDPEEIQSIDEQMIPFKGTIGFRQYLKDKPHSWGVKVFTRAGISGIVYHIEIYTGKGAVEISELGQGTDVVLWLVENLPRFMNFKLFFDNFYTGIDLIHKLRVEYGIESCGMIRSNRMRGAVLDTDANMKKKVRGSVDFPFERHSEVSVVKWYDNKPVHLASSYCAVTPIDKCQRWDGTTRKYVEVDRPRIVHTEEHLIDWKLLRNYVLDNIINDGESPKAHLETVLCLMTSEKVPDKT